MPTRALPTHDVRDALVLLEQLGTPHRLVLHDELVVEAAQKVIGGLDGFASHFDAGVVLVGAAIYDTGKILHRAEMTGPGDAREGDGRDLLVQHGLRVVSLAVEDSPAQNAEASDPMDHVFNPPRKLEVERLEVRPGSAGPCDECW